jgi:hypothetical protein
MDPALVRIVNDLPRINRDCAGMVRLLTVTHTFWAKTSQNPNKRAWRRGSESGSVPNYSKPHLNRSAAETSLTAALAGTLQARGD